MLYLQPITLSPGKEMGSHFPESLAHLKGNLAVLYNGFYQQYKQIKCSRFSPGKHKKTTFKILLSRGKKNSRNNCCCHGVLCRRMNV
jgi:hypothetical protein